MDDLNAETLRLALGDTVSEVVFLEETESTNKIARELVESDAPHGSIVVTNFQSLGRGRLDRSWVSPARQGLLFSVITHPKPDRGWACPLAAGVSVAEASRDLGVGAVVKWPNDVLVNGRKLSGCLAEQVNESVILGIGINVNTPSFEGELQSATSILIETGNPTDRGELLASILKRLLVLVDDPHEALTRYREWCDTIGRRVRVELAGRAVEQRASAIDDTGGLVLEDGTVVRAGDVVHLDQQLGSP